nr:hypothetical protein [Campylobacter volucris]
MAKISNLKNPYINHLYEEQRQKDLKDFKKGLAKELSDYYIKNEIPNNPGKIVDISQEPSNQPIITPLVDGTYLVEKDGKFYEASYAELKQMGAVK